MGRADARSAQIGGPDCITQVLQVSSYSGEPLAPILARNLLSKDRCRTPLGDEAVKSGPEMALIGVSLSLSNARKRLARTAAGLDLLILRPGREAEGVGPSADAGKEVALSVGNKVGWVDINYAPVIHVARREVPSTY